MTHSHTDCWKTIVAANVQLYQAVNHQGLCIKFATNIHKFTVMATNGTHKEDFHNGLISQITIDSGLTITYIWSTIWSWQEHD